MNALLERNDYIMLYVLHTQSHAHQQPLAGFLAKNPQAGYHDLIKNLVVQHQVELSSKINQAPYTEEEWIEEATWMQAALDYTSSHHQCLLIHQLQSGVNQFYDFRTDPTNRPELITEDISSFIENLGQPVQYFGVYDQLDYLRQNGANFYNLEKTFLDHSGRLVDTFVYDNSKPGTCFKQLLYKMISISSICNKSDVFLKSQAAKRLKMRFTFDELDQALNNDDYSSEKIEQFAYSSEAYSSFIITNFIAMHDEHRFFVVNNKIIDGSRTKSELTPVKSGHFGYYANMRRFEGKVNQNLKDFASEMVAEIAATSPKLSNQPYVIDVAYESTFRQPVIVELNPFFNSGLYATNPRLLIDALFQ